VRCWPGLSRIADLGEGEGKRVRKTVQLHVNSNLVIGRGYRRCGESG